MADVKLNILYITLDNSYIHHELDVVKIENGGKTLLKIPIHHLEGIVIFGTSNISPSLLNKCLQKGKFVSFLTERGRFLGRLEGSNSGNVLLRKEQFRKSENDKHKIQISKSIVAGKIQNQRLNILRTARDIQDSEKEIQIRKIAQNLEDVLPELEKTESMESIRGYEGISAKNYFSVFDHCIIQQKEEFNFTKRMKRPPRSRINALLSFVYSILTNDCIAACQSVGLDPYIGFLHEERPGRPSLSLDLIEEFRPFAERFVLTLINRKEIQPSDIEERIGSVYMLNNEGRKKLLIAYQKRKSEEITHHLLEQKCRIGELMQIQARVLARTIRGDIPMYIPYIWK